jgi:predicted ABC-type transport system involved in lysophospholipase L1 biosynthesis ATPase subunit
MTKPFFVCTHDEKVAVRCSRRVTLRDGRVEGAPHAAVSPQ